MRGTFTRQMAARVLECCAILDEHGGEGCRDACVLIRRFADAALHYCQRSEAIRNELEQRVARMVQQLSDAQQRIKQLESTVDTLASLPQTQESAVQVYETEKRKMEDRLKALGLPLPE